MKVYGNPMSTCTRKVLTTLAEKGHEAELVVIDFMKGEHKSPAHLARQPFGQVPVLDDDGFVLYESRAICRYLDQTLSGPALTPADAKGRARMEQWMSVETSNFTPTAMKIVHQLYFNKMRGLESDMKVVAEAKEGLVRPLEVLDQWLAKNEYLAGTFSLAEISFLPYIEYVYAAGVGPEVIEAHKNVGAWWKRISQRPSWKKVAAR